MRDTFQSQTLREFDDRFTAKMFGFKDWKDYYNHGHSYKKLPHVDIPTLIITAEDDPLSDANCMYYIRYTMYIIQYTLCIIHYTIYITHFTLYNKETNKFYLHVN